MVLKTTAESGALGSPARVTACFVRGSVPSTAPRSAGEGNSLTMRSMRGWMPRPLVEEAARTVTLDEMRLHGGHGSRRVGRLGRARAHPPRLGDRIDPALRL